MTVLIRGDMATAAAVAAPSLVYGPVGLGLTWWTYERLIKKILLNHTTTIQWWLDVGLLDVPRLRGGGNEVGGHDQG